jgi:hypothetical protein
MAQRFANVLSLVDDELRGSFSNPIGCVYELLAYIKHIIGIFVVIMISCYDGDLVSFRCRVSTSTSTSTSTSIMMSILSVRQDDLTAEISVSSLYHPVDHHQLLLLLSSVQLSSSSLVT